MSKAYKCDISGEIFEGTTDLQLSLSKDLEVALRFVLGIKISPENEDAPFYHKDLCPACAKSFVEWYKHARAGIRL